LTAAGSAGMFPGVRLERDIKATMRDGTVLRADVYSPNTPGYYPVLLRTVPRTSQRYFDVEFLDEQWRDAVSLRLIARRVRPRSRPWPGLSRRLPSEGTDHAPVHGDHRPSEV
jgi:hypothetical protein